MKFGYTIVYVDDVEKTIKFYEDAFGLSRKFVTPENDYGELLTGETTIAFAAIDLGNSNFKKGYSKIADSEQAIGIELAFVTENIEDDFQKAIEAGAILFEAIKEKPWGQKVGYLRDINGVLIEICTPVKN